MTTLTPSQRVDASRARLIERGGRRLYVFLQPDSAKALDALVSAGYAPTAAGVIAQALLDAQRKLRR